MLPRMLEIAALQRAYRERRLTPLQVVDDVLARVAASDAAVWISTTPAESLRAQAAALGEVPSPKQPLWGIPFAVKDNIDCAGLPTTAACPAFAYTPAEDAHVVARLRAAGALMVGKTNLDQFATGLNGTRSPYGAPRSVFDARYISGGSSSGSAVAVASGQVAFALGTDTAGSGRVPAAFNNLVGIKPTRGLYSNRGLVPACRSLDCISVFGLSVADALLVSRVVEGFDAADPYSRRAPANDLPEGGWRFGVLGESEREFYGDAEAAALYDASIARLAALGGVPVAFDYAPYRAAAALLYDGPWPAERLAPLESFIREHGEHMDPSVRQIIAAGGRVSGAEVFRGQHELERLRRLCNQGWARLDFLLLPTAPTIYTVEQLRAEPIALNSQLGRYTNFVNLLDYCAVAVPAGFRGDGLPLGVTLVAPAFTDAALASVAEALHLAAATGLGADRHATSSTPAGTTAA